jgi:hypothetical protein
VERSGPGSSQWAPVWAICQLATFLVPSIATTALTAACARGDASVPCCQIGALASGDRNGRCPECVLSCELPSRVLVNFTQPAHSLLRGHVPAQVARSPVEGNWLMPPPVSAVTSRLRPAVMPG